MQTKRVGDLLKDARSHHHISLEQLSQKTRIRLHYLEALERNKFSELPSAAYVKGYIKTYADIFGFDHQPLIALLRRDYKESARGTLVPREFINPKLRNRRLWTPLTMMVFLLGGLFLSLLLYVSLQWYQLQQPPFLEVTSPQAAAEVSSRVVVAGKTETEALLSINADPVSLQPDGTFSKELFLPREGLTTITITAADRRGKTNTVQRTVRVAF